MKRSVYLLLIGLFSLFCFAYPFAVIGVAFDVHPPFAMAWAGSVLLFIEGSVIVVAAMQMYGVARALAIGMAVIVLSYLVEAVGVSTGWPFGVYHYTSVLMPGLAGGVPLAVMFAWILIVLGAYSWVARGKGHLGIKRIVLGGLLAMLLDLAIEPVAFHIVNYWQWEAAGSWSYYGVPFSNFVAWFLVACLLLWLTDLMFARVVLVVERENRLARLVPKLLFVASLFMFGLVDLTHGYLLAVLLAVLAGGLLRGLQTTALPGSASFGGKAPGERSTGLRDQWPRWSR